VGGGQAPKLVDPPRHREPTLLVRAKCDVGHPVAFADQARETKPAVRPPHDRFVAPIGAEVPLRLLPPEEGLDGPRAWSAACRCSQLAIKCRHISILPARGRQASYACHMESQLDPDSLERRVMGALEAARRRAGLTVDEMVRRLRPALRLPEVGLGKAARHNWYDWRRRPHSIPAVALVAAAELAGVPVDRLLGADAQPDEARVAAASIADLQRRIKELESALKEREHPAVEQGAYLSQKEPSGGRFDALSARLSRLELRLDELGELVEELRREVAQYHVELMDLSRSRPIVAPQRSDALSSRSPAHG